MPYGHGRDREREGCEKGVCDIPTLRVRDRLPLQSLGIMERLKEMLIKSPGDGHGAGAQGIGEESPQRRFSGARTWNVKPDPPIFSGGCAQKKEPSSKFQDPNPKYQIPRLRKAVGQARFKSQI